MKMRQSEAVGVPYFAGAAGRVPATARFPTKHRLAPLAPPLLLAAVCPAQAQTGAVGIGTTTARPATQALDVRGNLRLGDNGGHRPGPGPGVGGAGRAA